MSEIKEFLKKEFVVIIAGIAALVSCALVPAANYIDYVNTDVIGILFSLMLIIAGLKGNNVISRFSGFIVRKTRILGTRKAAFVIVLLTFFLSMFVTNDAALIALVPITIMFFEEYPGLMIYAVVIQTIAANMGSMATPFGNPQNLMIFTSYDVSAWTFFKAAAPTVCVSFAAVMLLCLFMPDKPVVPEDYSELELGKSSFLLLYGVLFVLVLLSVFGVLNVLVVFASVCAVVIIIEPRRFVEIDYGLLVTFVFFFIFVENLQRLNGASEFMASLVDGREFFASVATSQVISNVPAAMVLTGFTDNWKAVMLGTDVGGLGTPVASLASLISLRIYNDAENSSPLKYLGVFLLVNFAVLAGIYAFVYFTQLG